MWCTPLGCYGLRKSTAREWPARIGKTDLEKAIVTLDDFW
jgi:hypothetical protein